MHRRRTHLDDIFQIDIANSSTPEIDDKTTNDKNNLLSIPANNCHFIRSHSLDVNSLNNSTASRGNVRRWSQSLAKGVKQNIKNGKQTVREKTINFMPSRMQAALLVDGQMLVSRDKEVEQMTQEIEQHEYLMEDSALGERLRMDTLRTLPQSLTTKRQIKAKITRSVISNSSTKNLSKIQKLKYKLRMWLTKMISSANNTISNVELWYGSMKKIEGHFGSGVSTYFKFLRWLFTLDLFLLIVSFGFIVFPQILFNHIDDKSQFNIAGKTVLNKSVKSNAEFEITDLLTAEGYFRDSILFYGSYTNLTFGLSTLHSYNLPYAYFMSMICMYLVAFIVVSLSMARSYRKSFIETSGGFEDLYAHSIFCSWDFGISSRKAAQLKHTSIYNELRELLHDMYDSFDEQTSLGRFWIIAVQIAAHVLVFGMLGGLGVGLWIALQAFVNDVEELPLSALYIPLTINLTILVYQAIFSWMIKMEDYKSDRLALHITLMRNFLLEVVIVGVLMTFWLTNRFVDCWETFIGQEIYRLVITDFIFFGIGNGLIHTLRFLVYKFIYPNIGLPEFDISRGSLGLIYNQILLSVGLFFSPFLAVIVIVKMIMIFYIKKLTLIYFCKPPSKLWRSAQTSTLFLVMTFLSLLGVVVALGYTMASVEVSKTCGPFTAHTFMFQIFLEGVLALTEGHWFWRVVMFFTKPAFIGGILLSMCVIVYYLRAKSKARIAMVKLLKEMLYMEAKDKEFLLGSITKITKENEWVYEVLDNDSNDCSTSADMYAESSSTWNYRNINSEQTESNHSSSSNRNDSFTPDSLRQRRY